MGEKIIEEILAKAAADIAAEPLKSSLTSNFGTFDRGTPVVKASRATVERLLAILQRPVPAGSSVRYIAVKSFFRQLQPLEAARLHGQLSDRRDPLRALMEGRLKRASIPKLVDGLRGAAYGYSARTAPKNLNDQSLKDAFLGAESRLTTLGQEPATSFALVEEEAYARELYEENTRRGTAQTDASDERLQEIAHEAKLYEATQTGKYSGIDFDRFARNRIGSGYYGMNAAMYPRFLEIKSNGEIVELAPDEVRKDNPAVDAERSPIFVDEQNKQFIVYRKFFKVPLRGGEEKEYFLEEWHIYYAKKEFEMGAMLARATEVAQYEVGPPDPSVAMNKAASRGWLPASSMKAARNSRFLNQSAPGPRAAPKSNVKPTTLPKPILHVSNVNLSGETAGTGGIKVIGAHRGQDGSLVFHIEGELLPAIKNRQKNAPNYDKKLPTSKEVGLKDYQRSHLWGPGFGDEARDGITYAPKDVNLVFQNAKIERRIRELRDLANKQGGRIELTIKAETYPLNTWKGHELLKEVSYRFNVRHANGVREDIGQVDISVSPPKFSGRPSGKTQVKVRGGSAGVWSLK